MASFSSTRVFVHEDAGVAPAPATIDAPEGASSAGAAALGHASVAAQFRRGTVGEWDALPCPVGPRKITYLDSTASGRALAFIEKYVATEVMPVYSNTHTTASQCGMQSHFFLTEARDIIRDSVGAHEREDVVLFTGRGATAASNLLAHHLLGGFNGSSGGAGPSASPAAGVEFSCKFPGCGRSYPTQADLYVHARSHADGNATARLTAGLPDARKAEASTEEASAALPPASTAAATSPRAYVIVGPYAHHSSILPWTERGAVPVWVQEAAGTGGVDVHHLLATLHRLRTEAPAATLIGVFTLASNVTGALCAPDAVNALMHAYEGIAVWDAAAAASHMRIEMNPKVKLSVSQALALGGAPALGAASAAAAASLPGEGPVAAAAAAAAAAGIPLPVGAFATRMDAVYWSMHKLPGGPGGSGVLVLARRLLAAPVPHAPGGGTVFYVHPDGRPRYLGNDAEREEGGTPDLLAAVRGGLAYHMLRSGGWGMVGSRETAMATLARARWAAHPCIKVIGDSTAARVPVVSFVVTAPHALPPGSALSATPGSALQLHWGFVAAVLNDVFGVQARGGCLCAGPYSQGLLGITASRAAELEDALLRHNELLRPGVVRVSFPFHLSASCFAYVAEAVEWVATHAWRLLPAYTPVADTAEWRVNRSLLCNLIADGYRAVETEAAASKGTSSNSSRPDRVALPDGRSACAKAVIACASRGDGEGHVAQAMRGTNRAHPRRWLQDLRFGGAEGTQLIMPSRRLTVAAVEDAAAPPPPAGALPGVHVDDADLAGPIPERTLYAAYLAEAHMLVAGLDAKAAGTFKAVAHHDATALLGAGAPRALRWFALATDFTATAPAEEVWAMTPSLSTFTHEAATQALQTLTTAPVANDTDIPRITPFTPLCTVPQDLAALLLRADVRTLDAATVTAWDGPAEGDTSAASDPLEPVADPSAMPYEGYAAAAKPTRPGPEHVSAKKGKAAREAAAAASGGSAAAASAVPAAVPAAPAAPTGTAQHLMKTMTEEERAARKARGVAFRAALAKMPTPEPELLSSLHGSVTRAIVDYSMIRDGDRVVVGLSGGKDSLTLLLLLLHIQQRAPIRFDLAAATVDPMYPGFDPRPLKGFCEALGVPYFYESADIMRIAAEKMDRDSICSFCSRMKRGILYSALRREGYNVLALGQHLDDLAESLVMSSFRNGLLRTQKAHYVNEDRTLRIIRPLCYVRERNTREFATQMALPIIPENCPACFSGPEQRYHIKKLLAAEEVVNPGLFGSLLLAMRPVMTSEGETFVRREHAKFTGGPKNKKNRSGIDIEAMLAKPAAASGGAGGDACAPGGACNAFEDD